MELNKLKGDEKKQRVLNERIVDLEDELKKVTDQYNLQRERNKVIEDEFRQSKSDKKLLQSNIEEGNSKIK